MHIEILEFYPMKHNASNGFLNGTLRIKLPETGIHILGVFARRSAKGFWFFTLPGRQGVHHETGKNIRYPFIAFEDENQQKELIAALRQEAPAFIEKRMTDKEKPLIWPQNEKKDARQVQTQKTKDNVMEAKQTSKEASMPIASIANKIWHDPPPRNNTRKICAYERCR